jgi:hypothetical protein
MLWRVPWKKFLVYGSGDVSKHASPNHSRASLDSIVELGLYMLLRFQKAGVGGNYETGNQAFSMHLRFLTIRGRGNLFNSVTETLQVLALYSELDTQVPLSRLKASLRRLCANGTFIGRDPCHQAFGPFDTEDVVFSSNPGGISVSRPSLPA